MIANEQQQLATRLNLRAARLRQEEDGDLERPTSAPRLKDS